MRYHHLLLSTLVGLVVAEKYQRPKAWIPPASDELPVVELRNVPVLTHDFAMRVTDQNLSPPIMAANANGNSGSKLKRTPSDDSHQLYERAACDPLPTLPNTYKINLSDAHSFRSDPSAALVANNARKA